MKLELKHLAPYLPYGLIIKTKYGNNQTMVTVDFYGLTANDNSIESVKPILRPLSDLTKEEHYDVYGEFSDWDEEQMDNSRLLLDSPIHVLPYHICIRLFEKHFDVFGLIEKGLAIDINILEV